MRSSAIVGVCANTRVASVGCARHVVAAIDRRVRAAVIHAGIVRAKIIVITVTGVVAGRHARVGVLVARLGRGARGRTVNATRRSIAGLCSVAEVAVVAGEGCAGYAGTGYACLDAVARVRVVAVAVVETLDARIVDAVVLIDAGQRVGTVARRDVAHVIRAPVIVVAIFVVLAVRRRWRRLRPDRAWPGLR